MTSECNNCTQSLYKTVLVISGGSLLSALTITGNLLVLISFRINKQLRTVTNYFLLSLAIADFTIGFFSIPIFTTYTVTNTWSFNAFLCNIWLSVDYTMSNASVANLLLICFDRYFSITRPLTYRAKRTPRRAAIMICLGWTISFFIWTPWIFAWPYIDSSVIHPSNMKEPHCKLPFADKAAFSIPTAIAAFYLPVTLMCLLYYRIYRETVKRRKELHLLQAQHCNPSSWSTMSSSNNTNAVTNTTAHILNGRTTITFGNGNQQHQLSTSDQQTLELDTDAVSTNSQQVKLNNSLVITQDTDQQQRTCWKISCCSRCCENQQITLNDDDSSTDSQQQRPQIITSTSNENGKICLASGRSENIHETNTLNKNESSPTKSSLLYDPWVRRIDVCPSSTDEQRLFYNRNNTDTDYDTLSSNRLKNILIPETVIEECRSNLAKKSSSCIRRDLCSQKNNENITLLQKPNSKDVTTTWSHTDPVDGDGNDLKVKRKQRLHSSSDEDNESSSSLTDKDKDIEYVESRLRGQVSQQQQRHRQSKIKQQTSPDTSTYSLYNQPGNVTSSIIQQQKNKRLVAPTDSTSSCRQTKYLSTRPSPTTTTTTPYNEITPIDNNPINMCKSPSLIKLSQTDIRIDNKNEKNNNLKNPVNGSVKTTKRRVEKVKDQKAAKTLSAILLAFIITWLPYNTNIIISTIKPDIFAQGFPMYWERF
ncbi:unnamed protein product, partial [Didymodactylos carnosus]